MSGNCFEQLTPVLIWAVGVKYCLSFDMGDWQFGMKSSGGLAYERESCLVVGRCLLVEGLDNLRGSLNYPPFQMGQLSPPFWV